MRIVSWNLNHCMRSADKRRRAWEYLRETLRADVALVQEAVPPSGAEAVYRPISVDRRALTWGSAVVVFGEGLSLKERPRVPLAECYLDHAKGDQVPDSHPGACAVADVLDSRGRVQFTAVSLYGQWELMPDGRTMYSCARLHRMISDLTGILAKAARRPVVVAGDLNVTTQIAYEGCTLAEIEGARVALSRLRSWGLTDCIAHTRAERPRVEGCSCSEPGTCAHVQTFRLKNSAKSRPTQLDYAFISNALVPRLKGCSVVQDEAAWALSDHCPIVLDLG